MGKIPLEFMADAVTLLGTALPIVATVEDPLVRLEWAEMLLAEVKTLVTKAKEANK